jgi:hypothetical protein
MIRKACEMMRLKKENRFFLFVLVLVCCVLCVSLLAALVEPVGRPKDA